MINAPIAGLIRMLAARGAKQKKKVCVNFTQMNLKVVLYL